MNDSFKTSSNSLFSQDKDNESKLNDWLETERISFSEKIPPPNTCLYLRNVPIFSLGNFSLIIGKAKSRKTFFIGIAVAAAIKDKLFSGLFSRYFLKDQLNILYFDTEQSNFHVQKSIFRICRLIGISSPNNLFVYGLRKFSPLERLERIDFAIYNTPGLSFVIIDGIRDLVTSINDEIQSTLICSYLLKWSEEKNIHIMVVLHQNKGDNNARGHLGSELVNKAETVLSVTKVDDNSNVSIIQAEHCRGIEPEPFAFEIDENELPRIIENWKFKSKKSKVNELTDEQSFKILKEVFMINESLVYTELLKNIKIMHEVFIEYPIGDNRVKELITIYSKKGWIVQEKERAPYRLGALK